MNERKNGKRENRIRREKDRMKIGKEEKTRQFMGEIEKAVDRYSE